MREERKRGWVVGRAVPVAVASLKKNWRRPEKDNEESQNFKEIYAHDWICKKDTSGLVGLLQP